MHRCAGMVCESAFGSKYVGSYEHDVKSGEGVFTWPDQKVYRGQWQDGNRCIRNVPYSVDQQIVTAWRYHDQSVIQITSKMIDID